MASKVIPVDPFDLVVFGGTGDLARRKILPGLYRRYVAGQIPETSRIIGAARGELDDAGFRSFVAEALAEFLPKVKRDGETIGKFLGHLHYIPVDAKGDGGWSDLARLVRRDVVQAFYFSVAPALFGDLAERLHRFAIAGPTARIVVEKPFGRDLESARALNATLAEHFDEGQIYRIDHYLGKEPVMDISYLRFANSVLEPVWRRNYVDSIQITMAEDFGVEDRGSFYDKVGTLRDVVQNHLLQLLALTGMEAPSGGAEPDPIRDRKLDFFRSIHAADPGRYVRGQYEGYQQVEGVAQGSTTETFAALRLEAQNWRWAGVPFFIRAGKAMPAKVTEIRVVLESPPALGIGDRPVPQADEIIFRIDPQAGACILMEAKQPGEEALRRVHLDLLFAQQIGDPPTPYERLLSDAIAGKPELFSRMDMVEETWRIVQPLIERPCPIETYPKGSWGPEGAAHLTAGYGGWRRPWMPQDEPYGPVGA